MAPIPLCRLALWQLIFVVHTNGRTLRAPANSSKQAINSAERETRAASALAKAKCDSDVNQDDLDQGLRLGAQFLVQSQRKAGNFRYEYNWQDKKETDEDNPVRQAGTLWGLTVLNVDDPKQGLMPVIRKGIKYFEKNSKEFSGGRRMMLYPGQEPQKLGSVALLALSHIEVLRRPEELESAAEKQQLEAHLAGYLKTILAARTGKKNFYKFYHGDTGEPFGKSSPYYDGECLLALVKAAKYLGHDHLWPDIKASAEAGWKKNVMRSLKLFSSSPPQKGESQNMKDDREDVEKRARGYYQWGTMAWYELTGLQDPEFQKYAGRTLEYGNWLLTRQPQRSTSNNGYAFEGIIPAFITAAAKGDDESLIQKYACAVREGMANLHSLQVGHRKAYGLGDPGKQHTIAEPDKDQLAQGGVQGQRSSAALRIDTTQHQLHALLMARRLLQQQPLI